MEERNKMATQPIPMNNPTGLVLDTTKTNGADRSTEHKVSNLKIILATTAAVLAVVTGGFTYHYVQTSSTISSLQSSLYSANSQINILDTQIDSLGNDITSYQSHVASLQGQLNTANTQISTLENGIVQYKSQIASLQGQLNTANTQINTLGNDITVYQSQITSLQNQLSVKTTELTALQDQVNHLQSIVNMSYWSTIATVTVNQPANQSSLVTYFQADYAGYITISGTMNTLNGYVQVTNSHAAYPYNNQTHSFITGTTLTIPVLPGTVAVYFGNTNTSDTAIANIAVVYHY